MSNTTVLYPITDYVKFASIYAIAIYPITCPKCGLSFTPTIPWASFGFRGLRCEEHSCGPNYAGVTAVPVDRKKRAELRRFCLEASAMLGRGERE